MVKGNFEIGPMLAYQGKDGCESTLCRRMVKRSDDGSFLIGPCLGYHCPICDEPCSMMGHSECQRTLGMNIDGDAA